MISVFFIHQKDSWYLWHTLRQARLTNPGADVFLITDRARPRYAPLARSVEMPRWWKDAAAFAGVYRHMSTNPHGFELFCFQRWFVLAEFMRGAGLERGVYLDSDVMCYADLDAEREKFAGADLTVTNGHGPENMFIGRRGGLEDFCRFVMESYADPSKRAALEEGYREHRARGLPGGICDMWLFRMYRLRHPDRVADAFEERGGAVFDDNVNEPQGFEMAGKTKRLQWRDGRPYGRRADTGAWVRFSTLHFQGPAKRFIPGCATARDWRFHAASLRARLGWFLGRAAQKAAGLLSARRGPA